MERDFVDFVDGQTRLPKWAHFFGLGYMILLKDKCSYESMVPSVALYENGTVSYIVRSDLTL